MISIKAFCSNDYIHYLECDNDWIGAVVDGEIVFVIGGKNANQN